MTRLKRKVIKNQRARMLANIKMPIWTIVKTRKIRKSRSTQKTKYAII
jgi:hypothetical protein